MNANDLFNAGTPDIIPKGDVARQAVDSLRGYAYQVLEAALAWLDINEKDRLFLEVAEDYAIMAEQALQAVQVKDTERSGSVTLNSPSIHKAVAAFVDLVERNPDIQVSLRFFTTSKIGTEQTIADRPAGMAGLEYWRKVAAGADPSPLRTILESDKFPESVRTFSKVREDAALRSDLILRIHWDCGKRGFLTLRQELEERLVVVGRDRFLLPAPEARRLADPLVYRVLKKSILNAPQDRVLTRADLYDAIDAATLTSVPRATVERLARFAADLTGSFGGGLDPGNPLSVTETDWLIDGTTLPVPQGMLVRDAVESTVTDALRTFGASILVGSSGLGKTTVSRAVAIAQAGAFFVVDFRNTEADETRRRLDMVLGRIGGLPSSVLILDDLNHFDDTRVMLSLARVIEASRRRNREVLVTCYRKPSLKALAEVGFDQGCVVGCPYFSKEEVRALVLNNNGDPDEWLPLAYLAGAGGHPQLTHAFVTGIAARGWPVKEIEDILSCGLSSGDIDATRDAARRHLMSALPKQTRNLLYRLSLIIGRFNRSLALTIGGIPPPVSQTGECMDRLVGPWIEATGRDLFRVSPLARSFGPEMLASDEQKRIHETIAVQMLRTGKINASDVDTIILHAIKGKSPQSLAVLGLSVLSAGARVVELLAEHLSLFRVLPTNRSIYAEDSLASAILRLMQFKLAAVAGEGSKTSDIAVALFSEIDALPEGEMKRALEVMAVVTVLGTMGVANYLNNWVALLVRLKTMVETDNDLQVVAARFQGSDDADGSNLYAMLLAIGSANVASVERLEQLIDELDELDANERALWLKPVEKDSSDYAVFINGPWATQSRSDTFDPADSAVRYKRMGEKTRCWGIRPLSLQCSVAQAAMLDEYQNNKEGALAVLKEAVSVQGADVILDRAIAKVHWRHGEHRRALKILRGIADQVGRDSPVERAFALREAAISAAKCDDWSQAEKWFLDAQSAAKSVQLNNMEVMAIGLGADSAVAALEAEDVGSALRRLAEAVEALADVDPEATLSAAYCHRVIRHTVLWSQSRIEGSDVKIGGRPIGMEAGTCSNPDPLPAVKELPLTHIDITWYMLAVAETAAGVDVGITTGLEGRLAEGPIPVMEFVLHTQAMQQDIGSLDSVGFTDHFTAYVESADYMLKEVGRLRTTFDPVAPERRQEPASDDKALFGPRVEQVAKETILAYGIIAALAGQHDAMTQLEVAMHSRLAKPVLGKAVFDHWNGESRLVAELDQIVVDIIKARPRNEHLKPDEFWMAGFRLFQWINLSNFKLLLMKRLAAWQRSGWKRICTEELFRLSRPRQSLPPIEEVLRIPENDRRFVAKLLLTSSEAVGVPLGSVTRDVLKAVAEGAE